MGFQRMMSAAFSSVGQCGIQGLTGFQGVGSVHVTEHSSAHMPRIMAVDARQNHKLIL